MNVCKVVIGLLNIIGQDQREKEENREVILAAMDIIERMTDGEIALRPCQIPDISWNSPRRFRKLDGSAFCHACPDANNIPENCPETCSIWSLSGLGSNSCQLAHCCPCLTVATPQRIEAFVQWRKRYE